MATVPRTSVRRDRVIDYPTSDGRPMAETDLHRQDMMDLIQVLEDRYADEPDVYVTGNLLLFYVEGQPRTHVSPDVFIARGVPKRPPRDHYKVWLEGKGPDFVIEVTSKTTRNEDQRKKWALYRDVLKVPEYFQFDPTEDYLRPSMQGHRLVGGEYASIEPVEGRLPSLFLGLELERSGTELRLYDPISRQRLPTRQERVVQVTRRLVEERGRTADAENRAEEATRLAADAQAQADRFLRELEELRRRLSGG